MARRPAMVNVTTRRSRPEAPPTHGPSHSGPLPTLGLRIPWNVGTLEPESHPDRLFGTLPDVRKHTQVNAVNNEVRPPPPVDGRPHAMVIPRRPSKQSASFRQRLQPELAGFGFQKTIQMRGPNAPVRCPFLHGRRVLRHRKLQVPGGIPDLDGFNKGPVEKTQCRTAPGPLP